MTFAEQPSLVADHAFTTGQVPEVTFEKVLSPSKMKIGVEHGHGCYADRLPRGRAEPGGRSPTSSGTRSRPPTT